MYYTRTCFKVLFTSANTCRLVKIHWEVYPSPVQLPSLEKSYLLHLCVIVWLITVAFIIEFLSSRFQKSVVNSTFLITFWLSSLWTGSGCSLSICESTKGFHRLAALPTHLEIIAGRDAVVARAPLATISLASSLPPTPPKKKKKKKREEKTSDSLSDVDQKQILSSQHLSFSRGERYGMTFNVTAVLSFTTTVTRFNHT